MPPWTLTETHPTQGRTFQRPPDAAELWYIWTGRVDGNTDSLHHVELRLLNASRDAHLFSDANIVNAWLSTKKRYPLVGVTVQPHVASQCLTEAELKPEGGDTSTVPSEPHFVIREHDLAVLRPHEIVFDHVACADDVPKQRATIWNGPRPLSDNMLVKLYVFRETDPQRTDVLHFIALIAHCVADGMANRTFMRCFVDTLARGGEPDSGLAHIPLEERLAKLSPTADLVPVHLRALSPAARRWRQAVGAVIGRLREERKQGGHTLPWRRTRATPYITARPGFISLSLTEAETSTVLANCRLHRVTYGSAYLALTQVAMTRVLYRRYLRGEISDEEWEYRKRQPFLIIGPVNLRPYLDESWYKMGGAGEFMLSVNILIYQLPFMTLGTMEPQQYRERPEELSNGAPPFSDLLTFDRLLHRAGLIKTQENEFVRHPLFFEVIRATSLESARIAQGLVQHYDVGTVNSGIHRDDSEVLAVSDMPSVIAHTGSNLGNVDLIWPSEYPLPPTHSLSPFSSLPHPAKAGYVVPSPSMEMVVAPKVAVGNIHTSWLHPRPGQIYLGTTSSRERLNIYTSYDSNVYEDEVVREWLGEVKAAVLWYLGQTHLSRRGQLG